MNGSFAACYLSLRTHFDVQLGSLFSSNWFLYFHILDEFLSYISNHTLGTDTHTHTHTHLHYIYTHALTTYLPTSRIHSLKSFLIRNRPYTIAHIVSTIILLLLLSSFYTVCRCRVSTLHTYWNLEFVCVNSVCLCECVDKILYGVLY